MEELEDNILFKIEGDTLTLQVNLKPKEKPPSKSGKSLIIASTRGNKRLVKGQEIFIGLNIYEKVTEKKE
ncbi:MAG TPA: hypothetical protein VMV49_14595 [Candidatus Deferrimicrobium sp.]|nr:hypothetical protein [Candidatus Deferrimicrobium sp.]